MPNLKTITSKEQYDHLYQQSIQDPQSFWDAQAKAFISWFSPWEHVYHGNFKSFDGTWFKGATLNACYNCLDRHLKTRAQQTALIWEGDHPDHAKSFSYQELYETVCRFANVLKNYGVKKGDRVCIYMPMIPEVMVAMLACARIGAIHSVVFGGFSAESLKTRILDAQCSMVITADESVRGGKTIALKQHVDLAIQDCPCVRNVIVIKHTGNHITWNKKNIWYHEAMQQASTDCPAEIMNADDPLFILYTSGSTGTPKGILHTTGGYLVYVAMTHQFIFDLRPGDIYWCTADVGWITGHSYLVYGPLMNGTTTLMFEGVPHYPSAARYWEIIDKYQVNIFYTAPTAIRALRKEGEQWLKNTSRKSLRILGTVGEPINPDVWQWYYDVVGAKRCPIVDTWWQTETGGIMISAIPNITPLKPGSASWPFFGVAPAIVNDCGNHVEKNQSGKLIMTRPWPGMMKTIYKDQQRFINTYFKEFSGNYLTGDNARQDADGYYWISGRNDDVIKVSGHRIGSEEVESALLSHPAIAEAAVVGIPHEIKGQGIYAFVTTKTDITPSEALKKELINTVREMIGPIATPEYIQWAQSLPKTRSGKIMRRILRKIAQHDFDDLGDTSTLADPNVVEALIKSVK